MQSVLEIIGKENSYSSLARSLFQRAGRNRPSGSRLKQARAVSSPPDKPSEGPVAHSPNSLNRLIPFAATRFPKRGLSVCKAGNPFFLSFFFAGFLSSYCSNSLCRSGARGEHPSDDCSFSTVSHMSGAGPCNPQSLCLFWRCSSPVCHPLLALSQLHPHLQPTSLRRKRIRQGHASPAWCCNSEKLLSVEPPKMPSASTAAISPNLTVRSERKS